MTLFFALFSKIKKFVVNGVNYPEFEILCKLWYNKNEVSIHFEERGVIYAD